MARINITFPEGSQCQNIETTMLGDASSIGSVTEEEMQRAQDVAQKEINDRGMQQCMNDNYVAVSVTDIWRAPIATTPVHALFSPGSLNMGSYAKPTQTVKADQHRFVVDSRSSSPKPAEGASSIPTVDVNALPDAPKKEATIPIEKLPNALRHRRV